MSALRNRRFYYMDFLRSVLIVMGVALHGLAIFSEKHQWKISSDEPLFFASYVVDFIHYFRMPAFFIISGFFASMILEKRSTGVYLKDRIIRLGVPLVFVGLAFNLPVSFLTNNNPEIHGWLKYFGSGEWLSHLWFLGALILYAVVVAFSWKFIANFFERSGYIVWLPVVLLVISYPFLVRVSWALNDTGIYFFIINKINALDFMSFFFLGVFYHKLRYSILIKRYLYVLLLAGFAFMVLRDFIFSGLLIDVAYFLSVSSFSFSLFAFAEKYFDKPTRFSNAFSEASYTIYLVHQPVIILMGFAFIWMSMSEYLSVTLILLLTSLVSFYFHREIVDKGQLFKFLINGDYKGLSTRKLVVQ